MDSAGIPEGLRRWRADHIGRRAGKNTDTSAAGASAAAEKMGQRILVCKWKDKKLMQAVMFVPEDFDGYGWQNSATTNVKEDKHILLALKQRHYRLLE